MKKILITDNCNLKSSEKNLFDEILYIGSAFVTDNNVRKVNLVRYFIRAHKRARIINKILIKQMGLNQAFMISLLKLSDKLLFESARIIEIVAELKKENNEITIKISNSKLLKELMKLNSINLKNIYFEENKSILSIKFSLFKYLLGSIILLLNSFKIRKQADVYNIFIMYNDKISFEFAKPYIDSTDTIIYALNSTKISLHPTNYQVDKYIPYKFITWKSFLYGIRAYMKNKKIIKNLNVSSEIKSMLISKLYNLEFNNMIFISLKDKFLNLKKLIGLFDSDDVIDYVTYNLNDLYNINTICTPHGINFKHKVNYISYGTNLYCFWSKNHLNRMESANLIDNFKTEKIITGNVVYADTMKYIENKKSNKKSKRILIVGEYFSNDNFYSSPFNFNDSKRLFESLKKFISSHQDCSIIIRTRLNDEYSNLAREYLTENVQLSSPKESLIKEINSSDLIISVFSNALHEALLLNKKVLQVNFLGIENYRDLAKDGLVYYADSEELLERKLEEWYTDKLPELDYKKHLEKYANNGIFTPLFME